ncbi:MAG: type II toxin-antitoxin system HicB family antitoxin [Synergistaceae bacterium]|nr:type II toxin-antitoxin system HicB family antitoxin [Synergistaceae bacterium]
MQYVFPTVIDYDSEADAYNVYFPDLENCYTCGYGLYDTLHMAWDVLNLTLFDMEIDGKEIPPASNHKDIDAGEGFVQYIRADTESYAKLLQALNPEEAIDTSKLKPRQKRPDRDDIPYGTVQRILDAAGISEEEIMSCLEDDDDDD